MRLHLVPGGHKTAVPRVMVDEPDGTDQVVPAGHDVPARHRQLAAGSKNGSYNSSRSTLKI